MLPNTKKEYIVCSVETSSYFVCVLIEDPSMRIHTKPVGRKRRGEREDQKRGEREDCKRGEGEGNGENKGEEEGREGNPWEAHA